MTSEKFFDFGSKFALTNVMAVPQDLKLDENGISEKYRLIKGLYDGIDFPVIFKHKMGKKFTDIMDTGLAGLYLISDSMKKILEENQLTGWKNYPIKILDKKNNEIMGYHGFSITGRCDPIDFSKSDIIEKRMVPTGPLVKFYKGVTIDNWDGSDFFSPTNCLWKFVSEKSAKILTKSKITNMRLTDIADIQVHT